MTGKMLSSLESIACFAIKQMVNGLNLYSTFSSHPDHIQVSTHSHKQTCGSNHLTKRHLFLSCEHLTHHEQTPLTLTYPPAACRQGFMGGHSGRELRYDITSIMAATGPSCHQLLYIKQSAAGGLG